MKTIINKILFAIATWAFSKVTEAPGNSPGPTEPSTKRVIDYARLRPDVLDALERDLPAPYAGPQTSEIMAGYLLGVQAVLKKLRDSYAVD